MTGSAGFSQLRLYRIGLAFGVLILAGCSLPEPDGTEAAINERAANLAALAPAQGHDAKSVVRNGLLLNPDVRAAASAVAASADEVRVQRAVLFPSLGLSIGGGKGAAGNGDPAMALRGRQLLLDFGDTRRAVTAADIDLQINYITFQQTVDAAIYELLAAYDDIRKNVSLLDVRRKQFAAMQDLHSLIADRTKVGAVASSDILESQKRLQAAEFLVLDTELALAEARDRMARLSGQNRGGAIPALGAGSCEAPGDSDALRTARLTSAKAQLNLERAERASLPRAYIEPLARKPLGKGGVSLGLNVGIDSDLLQGGALTARANAARNTRDGANADVDATRRNVVLDEGKLRREIATAGQKRKMLKRQIDLLEQTRQLYRSQYFDLGTRKVSELLSNEEEFYARKAELIELETELNQSRIVCAARDRSLRRALKIEDSSLYGYPLASDAI